MRCSRSAAAAARCCSIACTRRSRSANSRSMRWKAASAPRRRSSRPASSAVICAASCCSASRFCAQDFQLRLLRVQAALGLRVLGLKPRRLLALLRNRLPLGLARVLVARGLRLPLLQAPLDALRLGFHLLQRRAQVGRFALGLPPLLAARSPVAPSALRSRASALRLPSPPAPAPSPAWPAGLRSRAARASAPADLRWPACRPSPSSDGSTRPPA